MSISDLASTTADTIIGNLYTEEDRKFAELQEEIQEKRSQTDSSVSNALELRLAKDEFVNPDVTEYRRKAVAMVDSRVPSVAKREGDSELAKGEKGKASAADPPSTVSLNSPNHQVKV